MVTLPLQIHNFANNVLRSFVSVFLAEIIGKTGTVLHDGFMELSNRKHLPLVEYYEIKPKVNLLSVESKQ